MRCRKYILIARFGSGDCIFGNIELHNVRRSGEGDGGIEGVHIPGRSNGIGNSFGFLVVPPYAAEGPTGIFGIICRGVGTHEVWHINGTQFLAGSGKG